MGSSHVDIGSIGVRRLYYMSNWVQGWSLSSVGGAENLCLESQLERQTFIRTMYMRLL